MNRLHQIVLIASILAGSWLGMQAVHELGHVSAAILSGGVVDRVVLHPLTISRTDLSHNPHPLIVVWAGPIVGVVLPNAAWLIGAALGLSWAFVLRFFAGFCLLANGLYIGVGSFDRVGDCGEMLRHGSPLWHLWSFGAIAATLGLLLWHGQGKYFGLGRYPLAVSPRISFGSLIAAVLLLCMGIVVGGR